MGWYWRTSILLLATVGCYVAAYFTLVYYHLIPASSRFMPAVCRLEERTCQTVLNTKFSHLFGLPNSMLGALYYTAVIIYASVPGPSSTVQTGLMVISWFTVAVGIFLIYTLFFVIRIACPLCMLGHGINLTLALILTFTQR